MKFKLKENKGITLIALVITIIVLLILAGITISTLMGENGLLTKAEQSKTKTGIAGEKEIINLAITGLQTGNRGKKIFTRQELEDEIHDLVNNREVKVEGEGPYTVTFEDTERSYDVSTDAKVSEAPEKVETRENLDELEGNGTEDDPYLIQSIEDLVILATKVKNAEVTAGEHFELKVDLSFTSRNSYIDPDKVDFNGLGDINGNEKNETLMTELTTGTGFMGIGEYAKEFPGIFKGNGNAIKNLYQKGETKAFFKYTKNAEVTDLKLENVNIEETSGYGAVLVAYAEGDSIKISNCTISGNLNADKTSYSGGFLGMTNYSIKNIDLENLENNCNIVGCQYGQTGGIAGHLNGGTINIKNCTNNRDVICAGGTNVGGIVGTTRYGSTANILNCKNKGKVKTTNYAGGIVGCSYSDTMKIEKCINDGDIEATSYNAGGITGYSNTTSIEKSYNTGTIKASDSAAGIASYQTGGEITNCYNKGHIICNRYIGGIGANISGNTKIENCYNIGIIEMADLEYDNPYNFGGIAGYISGTLSNCYNVGEMKVNEYGLQRGGTGGIAGYLGIDPDTEGNSNNGCLKGIYTKTIGNYSDTDNFALLEEATIKQKIQENLTEENGWDYSKGDYPTLKF